MRVPAPGAPSTAIVPVAQQQYHTAEETFPPKSSPLGNSRYCCCRLCIFSEDALHSSFIFALIAVVSAIFVTTVCPKDWISTGLCLFLSVASSLSLFFAISCDPGIIPPQPPDTVVVPMIVSLRGVQVECKVCPTCHVLRPPRSSHCRTCNNCVEVYDHHCGVVGSCVGRRTFRFFTYFFCFCSMDGALVFIRSIITLATLSWSDAIHSHWGRWRIIACFALCFLLLCTEIQMAAMAAWYLKMACLNETQKDVAHRKPGEINPYDQGFCRNFFCTMCGPLGRSKF